SSLVIRNNTTLIRFLDKITREKEEHKKNQRQTNLANLNLIKIPTGIYIYEFDITSTYKSDIVFDIWQRYPKLANKKIVKDIELPQVLFMTKTELYKFETETEEIICWHINGTFRQNFSYENYPFDPKILSIRVKPVEIHEPIILVPDLNAYKITTPSS